jgi:hypothetical protein
MSSSITFKLTDWIKSFKLTYELNHIIGKGFYPNVYFQHVFKMPNHML